MPTVILLLPTATYRAADFLAAAGRLGVDVVVASERRQAMDRAMGDRALVVDLGRPESAVDVIVERHRSSPVDAVVAVDDQGALVAAMASDRLGLAQNPPSAVAATRDKAAQRRAFAAAGVRQPDFREAGPADDIGALASAVGLPCVVKPVSLSASRGVIRADTPDAARVAAARVRRILEEAGEDARATLLVERFVEGAEVAVEALLRAGRLEVLAVFDKPDPLDGPYFEETIYVTPSRLSRTELEGVENATAHAATALGLCEGPIHAELRVPGGGEAWMLEVAARSIGGLCSRALRFGTATTLEELILRHALGLPAPAVPGGPLGPDGSIGPGGSGSSGVMMLPIPHEGTLEAVEGRDRALGVDGIVGLEVTIAPGRHVRPLPEGDRYLGFLFARAATPGAVDAALRTAHSELDVVIRPAR